VKVTSAKRKKMMIKKMDGPVGSANSTLGRHSLSRPVLPERTRFTLGQSTRMRRQKTAMIHLRLLPDPRLNKRKWLRIKRAS